MPASLRPLLFSLGLLTLAATAAPAQPLGNPDRGAPGDEMIQAYLRHQTELISAKFADDCQSRDAWLAKRPQYAAELDYMLGLSPRPEKTPLHATVTGTLQGDGYAVDMLHYQSRPGLYVTGNLYRPAVAKAGEKLPAIFYVCGHSGRGRNGNKVAYQSHGIWFARHGYVCLVVDTLQLGEIGATHHGTYNLNRWWWHSRGYTPAGVEAWNGVRGIDYLVSRDDVDPERIGVTGISGGGAATFWVAAVDDRVKVAVPVSGMADLESYVPNRVINGHCDCMFLYNTFQWPWTRIAGMVAPRPMLFVNSDQDGIFPMDANERIAARLERLYSLYGKGDQIDTVVSVGGHAYRHDIRQAAYQFFNAHLKGDARPVGDSEVDIVSEGGSPGPYPIAPEKLRVFPTDTDLPADQRNTKIDEEFVPLAQVAVPVAGEFEKWRKPLLSELRRVSFSHFPETIPPAQRLRGTGPATANFERMSSEPGIEIRLRYPRGKPGASDGVLLVVLNAEEAGTTPDWVKDVAGPDLVVVLCEPRGIGETQWTAKNPPNYVTRSHVLLGRTVDSCRVWDVLAVAKYVAGPEALSKRPAVELAGKGPAGLLAAYAAAIENNGPITKVTLVAPPSTHMAPTAPPLLNVLRVCDVPHVLGLLAPRPLRILEADPANFTATTTAYVAANAAERFTTK